MDERLPVPEAHMTSTEAKERVENDPTFVNMKRFSYSIEALIERYPDG